MRGLSSIIRVLSFSYSNDPCHGISSLHDMILQDGLKIIHMVLIYNSVKLLIL